MEIEKIKPMLSFLSDTKVFKEKDWTYEAKYDGTRCICYKQGDKIKFLNRRGIWFEIRYPELVEALKKFEDDFIIDGEIILFDKEGRPSFFELTHREHISDKLRIELLSKSMPATYVVFDILNLNSKSLVNLPLIERKKTLEKTIEDSERVKKSFYTEDGELLWKNVKKLRLEGIVAKRKDSRYEIDTRSKNWLKIKVLKTLDCIICAYTSGEGKRKSYFGAFLCGAYYNRKLIYLGRVGTGWTESDMKNLLMVFKNLETNKNPFDEFEEEPKILKKIHWLKPVLVAEIEFMNLSEDLKMRAPSFKRIRDDKSPNECYVEI